MGNLAVYLNIIFNILHPLVQHGADIRAFAQVRSQLGRSGRVNVLLIPHLVLQTGPEVHGDGSQLDLYLHMAGLLLEEEGNGEDEMQTSVAVGLGVLDVVLHL